MIARRRLLGSAVLLIAAAPEPDDYRMEKYRAPVPATLRGAHVIGTEEAHRLWETHAAFFVDVLPRVPKPANLAAGTIWQEKPHDDIPGSMWLPDTGYGALAPAMLRYFAQGLARASGGDKNRELVFYCLPDCWMSWNAAKRALTLGYANVAWYPDGATGWQNAGYRLDRREPEKRPLT